MAIANNWEVLIARGIVTAPKTVIIIPPELPDTPVYEEPKRFSWLKGSVWTRAKVEVKTTDEKK